jgi:hypothetical protein
MIYAHGRVWTRGPTKKERVHPSRSRAWVSWGFLFSKLMLYRRPGLRPAAFTILTPILLPTVRASRRETTSILLSALSLILTLENAWRSENVLVVAGSYFRDIRFAAELAAVPAKWAPVRTSPLQPPSLSPSPLPQGARELHDDTDQPAPVA